MVRLRSSRGFGRSGLAKLAHAQQEMSSGVTPSSVWEAVRTARDCEGSKRLEALEKLARYSSSSKDNCSLMLGMGVVAVCKAILETPAGETPLMSPAAFSPTFGLKRTLISVNLDEMQLSERKNSETDSNSEAASTDGWDSWCLDGDVHEADNELEGETKYEGGERDEYQEDGETSSVRGSNTEVQHGLEERLYCIKILAAVSQLSESNKEFLENDMIGCLVKLLKQHSKSFGRPEQHELASFALATMAQISVRQKLQQECLQKGVVELMIKLGHRTNEESIRKGSVAILVNLSNHPGCAKRIVKRSGVEVCISIVQDFKEEARFMALGVVKNVLDLLENHSEMEQKGFLDACLFVCNEPTRNEASLLALFLISEFAKVDELVDTVLQREIPKLCKGIIEVVSNGVRHRVLALQVIDSLSSHSSRHDVLEDLMDLGFVDLCSNICASYRFADVGSDEAEARAGAFSVLYNFARDKLIATELIWHADMVEVCKGSVSDNLMDIRSEALLVLQALSAHKENHAELLNLGIVEVCCKVIRLDKNAVFVGTIAVLDTLRSLAYNSENRRFLQERNVVEILEPVLASDAPEEVKRLVADIRRKLVPSRCCVVC